MQTLNIYSVGLATNNTHYPSVGITKRFNNNQQVPVGGELLDIHQFF